MPKLTNTSISRKLTWMNLIVSGTALVLACTAFIGYDLITFRGNIVRNLSNQAQLIGNNSASALLFDDPQSAQTTLSTLKAGPNILSAVIYSPDGTPLASYSRDRKARTPEPLLLPPDELEVHAFKGREIALVRSIVFQGKPVGTIYLRSSMEAINGRLYRYVGIAVIVLLGSLMAALPVSAIFRRSIAKPIIHLAEIARAVSHEKDYSVRATPISNQGELTFLTDAFNEMLAQIDQSERDLRKARDELEQRVKERTAELESAKNEVEAFSHSILRAKDEIERASKFKDQFLSTMSHELRTPLNAVLGFSELLTEERYGPLNERQLRYVNHVHTGGKHLLRLINDILDLSKIEAGRLQLMIESVRVTTSFSEVVDAMRPLADKKSQSLLQFAPEELSVRADSTRFKQVLMNLIGNAIKFTPEGGKIELAIQQQDEMVRVEVRDNGPGIPPEDQKKIFEAFYRLRRSEGSVEGTGLGLAITQRLVELHGGQLGLESIPGKGSCFYFTLPRAETFERPSSGKGGAAIVPGEAVRILVVEDDLSARQLLKSHLESAGYEVHLCEEPQFAVETAAELRPHAVTMDIMMKPVNGWQVLSNLKGDSRTTDIPVIMVTILDQQSTGALLGADEYIVKPVERSKLLDAVERCLNQRGRAGRARPILVVEDDMATREFVSELLTKHGFVVSTAADGAEARFKVSASLPELVILDLLLPEVNGFQLIAEWREDSRTADLPIFVLTSKELTMVERDYIWANTGALYQKHDRWQEALIRQLQRAIAPVLIERA